MAKKLHILAIDDEPNILIMLRRILEQEGYSVDTSPDGTAGLDMLDQHPPDLILLDVLMPGLDGYQVLKLIRERSDAPVIMVTALRESVSTEKALGIGADDYVIKPFYIRELLARIRTKLRRTGKSSSGPKAVPGTEAVH